MTDILGYTDNKTSRLFVEILDLIDKLRLQGLQNDINLPQIIVCGAQSSGKSSVLEAISNVQFPVKDGPCTRFPIELVIRRCEKEQVKVSIIPMDDSETDRGRLEKFSHTASVENFSTKFETIVNDAATAMGVCNGTPFSSNILRVEIFGPTQRPLTLVDLPGFYSAGNSSQPAEGREIVRKINAGYMKNPRSIILAVVMASTESVNQEVTELARLYDPSGTRTMGLITKPDRLSDKSPSQARFLKLARNEEIKFDLGWHVLKNRDWAIEGKGLDVRNASEKEFFLREPWCELDPSKLGIEALRRRLTETLDSQMIQQMPNMEREVKARLERVSEDLNKLGIARETMQSKRMFLRTAAKNFDRIVTDACLGQYHDQTFFGNDKNASKTKMYMAVQKAMKELSANIKTNGMKYHIVEDKDQEKWDDEEDTGDDSRFTANGDADTARGDADTTRGNIVLRSDFIKYVKHLANNNIGRQLPGMFSPLIVSQLFKEQTNSWRKLTENFIEKVNQLARVHVRHALDTVLTDEISGNVMAEVVNVKMEEIRRKMLQLAEEQLVQHTGEPYTENDEFKHKVSELSSQRRQRLLAEGIARYALKRPSGPDAAVAITGTALKSLVRSVDEALMQDESESTIIDNLIVYYDMAAARYLDILFIGVVDKCLLQELPRLFDCDIVLDMADSKVDMLASETLENIVYRKMLTERKDGLESVLVNLRQLMDKLPVKVADLFTEEPKVPFRSASTISGKAGKLDDESSVLSSNMSTTRAALKTMKKFVVEDGHGIREESPARIQKKALAGHTERWIDGDYDRSTQAIGDEQRLGHDEDSEDDDEYSSDYFFQRP